MNQCEVTVIIPTTGRPELARALASVRLQRLVPIEILVVLDNPAKLEFVTQLCAKGERIIQTHGSGSAAARQAGVEAAQHPLVAFLDDDDWWVPEKLLEQVPAMLREGATWSLTGAIFHGLRGERRVPRLDPDDFPSVISFALVRKRPRYGDGFVQSSTLVAFRDVLRTVPWTGGKPIHDDWDLALRLERDGQPMTYVDFAGSHVAQGSSQSLSMAGAWRKSADWFTHYELYLEGRPAADFLVAVVLRKAIATLDKIGFAWVFMQLLRMRTIPHCGAVAAALGSLYAAMTKKVNKA